jgi:hypothetical protein
MRHPLSSRRSYREVLIAAGLTAALGVSTACAEPAAAAAPQPQADGNGTVEGSAVLRPAGAEGAPESRG